MPDSRPHMGAINRNRSTTCMGERHFQVGNRRTPHHLIPYIGNKSGFAYIFDELVPEIGGRHVYDVFGGGASFSLYASARFGSRNVTYNDNNPTVVNLIRHVRDEPVALWDEYETHRARSSGQYYLDVRRGDLDGLEGAGRFLYLAKNAFSGKIRFNAANRFNSPMRKGARCPKMDRENLLRISRTIADMRITNLPYQGYEDVRDSFLYLDPPYLNNPNGHYNGTLDAGEFIGFVKRIEARNMVMISEQNKPRDLNLSAGYRVYPIHLNRSLQYVTKADSAEIIAINYSPARD